MLTQHPGHCLRCGIDLDPCPFCAIELEGGRLGLAPGGQPEPVLPRGGLPRNPSYSALSSERRRASLAAS